MVIAHQDIRELTDEPGVHIVADRPPTERSRLCWERPHRATGKSSDKAKHTSHRRDEPILAASLLRDGWIVESVEKDDCGSKHCYAGGTDEKPRPRRTVNVEGLLRPSQGNGALVVRTEFTPATSPLQYK